MRAPLSARPMAGGAGPHGPGTMEREPRPRGLWRDCGMGRCRSPQQERDGVPHPPCSIPRIPMAIR